MPRFVNVGPGEWQQPVRKGYKMACCDCGLVHNMEFRVHKGKIQIRGWRNSRSTAQMRRHMKFILTASASPE